MKITKKIFVGLLTLAVLVSCFAFAAMAEEPSQVHYDDVLEYYEQDFLATFDIDDIAAGTAYTEALVTRNKSTQGAKVEEDATIGKYVSLYGAALNGSKATYGNNMFRWTDEDGLNGIVLRVTLGTANPDEGWVNVHCDNRNHCDALYRLDDPNLPEEGSKCTGCTKKLKYELATKPIVHFVVYDEVETGTYTSLSKNGIDILCIDSENGVVQYTTVVEGVSTLVAVEGFTYNGDDWYDVAIDYSTKDGTYSFTLTSKTNAENTVTVSDIPVPYDVISTIKIGTFKDDMNKSTDVRLADLYLQGGTFVRDDSEKQAKSEQAILQFLQLLEEGTETFENQLTMVDTYNKLLTYGFTTDNAEVNAAINTLAKYAALVFANKVEECVDLIDTSVNYAARYGLISAYVDIRNAVPEDLSLLTEEEKANVLDNLQRFDNEYVALEVIKADSLALADAIEGLDLESEDYAHLKQYVDAGVNFVKADPTVAGAEEGVSNYLALVEKFETLTTLADGFKNNVNTAGDMNVSFADRYSAFIEAKDNVFENETFPGVAEALASFRDISALYTQKAIAAENYIYYVQSADLAMYITAKKEFLDLANGFAQLDYFEFEFEGVAEAKTLYDALLEDYLKKSAAAAAYIEAVNAIADATDFVAAVERAVELSAEGDIEGIPGVPEANILLSNYKSSIEVVVAYGNKLVRLAGSLANAKSLEERFNIIADAFSIDSELLDMTNANVKGASDALNKAVEDYNKDVQLVNGEFTGKSVTVAPKAVLAVVPKKES